MKIKVLLSSLLCFLISFCEAQETNASTSLMRSSGRIYVVVAVMLTILIGLILYLVRLDRRLSRLEKEKSAPAAD